MTAAVNDLLVVQGLVTSDTGTPTPDSFFAGTGITQAYDAVKNMGASLAYAVRNNGDTASTTWTNSGAAVVNLTSANSYFDTGTTCPGAATAKPTLLLLGVGQ